MSTPAGQMALTFDRAPRLSQNEYRIYGIIGCGIIGKAELAARVGLSVRLVRRIIANLITEHGFPIGCSSARDRGGYYIITNPAEIEKAQAELTGRALKLLKRAYALKRSSKLAAILGQLEL